MWFQYRTTSQNPFFNNENRPWCPHQHTVFLYQWQPLQSLQQTFSIAIYLNGLNLSSALFLSEQEKDREKWGICQIVRLDQCRVFHVHTAFFQVAWGTCQNQCRQTRVDETASRKVCLIPATPLWGWQILERDDKLKHCRFFHELFHELKCNRNNQWNEQVQNDTTDIINHIRSQYIICSLSTTRDQYIY